ncbi:helix-turn-helix domain-containing protein [Bacillus aerolatus]|uniref:Helix-turn-helix domain-containing protein n=1 Tax=Bacillus aerolatus TaxID=2653354 RepID=A0A6I1FG68_9BACI|nr:IclR family transcriptional regulator [Bacillus aerolatus]KAB7707165.1 helix-turn-helix domain-containing protein [Bacillus aerolatus]
MSTMKTLEILDLFDFETRELTVAKISEKLNQPQSTVYRHVRILKEKGYLMDDHEGNYKLGYKFLKFAKIVTMDTNITVVSNPIMQKLTKKIGETSQLMVYSDLQAICLSSVNSGERIQVSAEVGQIFPLYGGSSSKALLAFLDESILKELFEKGIVKKHTENTKATIDDLKKDLQLIQKRGYAFSDGEIDQGVASFGVPIYDYNHRVIASLSIVGPRERLLEKDDKEIITELIKARDEIQSFL